MAASLGRTIQILRQAKRLKTTELAHKSGLSVSYLSLLENDERQPSLDVIRRLANSLGIPAEALIAAGMGTASGWTSSGAAAEKIAHVVDELVEIEEKLKKLIESTEESRATRSSNARPHRRGNEKE